jgi:predicted 2-oxoglutarate/Fe(II)-dependent dioxygenase YbiX
MEKKRQLIYQEKLFSKEECEQIKELSNKSPDIKEYYNFDNHKGRIEGKNKIVFKGVKTSYNSYIILNNKDNRWIFDKILNWFESVSGVEINKASKVFNCTLHRYEKGDAFARHQDLMRGFDARRYNLGIQINDDYEGGEYVCWDAKENEILISKEIGTALAYHCNVWHEIREVTKGERWSIVMPIEKQDIIEKSNLI